MTVRIINADVMAGLAQLEDESVQCVVTSPPYWGLRDYGVPGQLGLEPTLGEHIDKMTEVFREVRRVLRKDGTLWLNYGDSYAAAPNGRKAIDIIDDDRTFRDKPFSTVGGVLKPKDLCGQPWRVAFALQADGWWLRQDIIWSKPNPMPESIKDRCTRAHEYLFLLAKSQKYFFDAQAISESSLNAGHVATGCKVAKNIGSKFTPSEGAFTGTVPERRNKRSVWEIATQPFSEAHFATFPPSLIEPCVKAGSKEGDTILDPFGGSGTTGMVADRLKRNAILIELNPEYAAMAERRIKGDCPMFAEVGNA